MWNKSVILMLAAATFLTSCDALNKGKPSTSSPDLPTISGAPLMCEDNCVAQVAGIFNPYDPDGAGYCTATLVGEFEGKPVLATNKHCVLGANEGDCHELIAEFPATPGFANMGARCSKIVAQSADELDPQAQDFTGKDYAFFTLDRPVNRPALTMAREGVDDGAILSVPYLDTSPSDNYLIRHQTCHSAMHSLVNMSYDHPGRRILSLFGCGIPSSGAGAPVLDKNGKYVALIFEGENNQFMNTRAEIKPGAEAFVHKRMGFRNFALRLGCLDVPEFGLSVDDPAHCERVTRLSSPEEIQAAGTKQNTAIEERSMLRSFNEPTHQNVFKFEFVLLKEERVNLKPNQDLKDVEMARPKCFKNPISAWIGPFMQQHFGGLAATYKESALIHRDNLMVYTFFELDEDLHVQTKVGKRLIPQEITFNPYQLAHEQISAVTITTPSTQMVEYLNVPLCSDHD